MFWVLWEKSPTLEDVFPEYRDYYKDSDVIYIKDKEGKLQPTIVGNLRTLAIQEKYPRYRYSLYDADIIDLGYNANDAREEFAQEEKRFLKKEKCGK